MKKLLCRLSLIFGLILCFNIICVNPSFAMVREIEEAPGQMLYQSRQSIRDIDNRPWQVVLFKRVIDGEVEDVDLRLVGYPEQIEFRHPDDLILHTRTGQDFKAVDRFAKNAPGKNIGEYDLTDILPELPTDEPVVLEMPTEQSAILKIPVSVVLEWKLIA